MTSTKVLLIDHDPATTATLSAILGPAGIEVESATCSAQAMSCLREGTYQAVVLDPLIRECLNGYAVLSFIEFEQPHVLEHLLGVRLLSRKAAGRSIAPARGG